MLALAFAWDAPKRYLSKATINLRRRGKKYYQTSLLSTARATLVRASILLSGLSSEGAVEPASEELCVDMGPHRPRDCALNSTPSASRYSPMRTKHAHSAIYLWGDSPARLQTIQIMSGTGADPVGACPCHYGSVDRFGSFPSGGAGQSARHRSADGLPLRSGEETIASPSALNPFGDGVSRG